MLASRFWLGIVGNPLSTAVLFVLLLSSSNSVLRQIDSTSIVILDPHGCILSSKKLASGRSEESKIDVQ